MTDNRTTEFIDEPDTIRNEVMDGGLLVTDNRTTELLPCPFCGGEAYTVNDGGRYWTVECHDCAAHTGLYATKDFAIAAWNARAEWTCEFVECGICKFYHADIQFCEYGIPPCSKFERNELNAREERTCEIESSYLNDFTSEHECWWEFDLSCGHHVIGDTMNAPNYCKVCGAKVVDA